MGRAVVWAALALAGCTEETEVVVDAAVQVDAPPVPTGLPAHLKISADYVGCQPTANGVLEFVGADYAPRFVTTSGEILCGVNGQWVIGCTRSGPAVINWSLRVELLGDLSGGSGSYFEYYPGAEAPRCSSNFTITTIEVL